MKIRKAHIGELDEINKLSNLLNLHYRVKQSKKEKER